MALRRRRRQPARALTESRSRPPGQQARTALAAKGGLVDAYGGDKDPADLRGIGARREGLHARKRAEAGARRRRAERTRAGAIAADEAPRPALQERVEPVAGTPRFDEGVKPYAAALAKVSAVSTLRDRGAGQAAAGCCVRALRSQQGAHDRARRRRPGRACWRSWSRSTAAAWCAACSGGSTGSSSRSTEQVEQIERIRATAAELAAAAGGDACGREPDGVRHERAVGGDRRGGVDHRGAQRDGGVDRRQRARGQRGRRADRRHDARHAGAGGGDLRRAR